MLWPARHLGIDTQVIPRPSVDTPEDEADWLEASSQ